MRALLLLATCVLAPHAHAQDYTRQNDSRVGTALYGLGVDMDGPAWGSVLDAFEALYPEVDYSLVPLSSIQARAVAYVAVLYAVDGEAAGATRPVPQTNLYADARARAALALASVGGYVAGPARDELADRFGEAAAAAGEAGCGDLATWLSRGARSIRTSGRIPSGTESAIERALSQCVAP